MQLLTGNCSVARHVLKRLRQMSPLRRVFAFLAAILAPVLVLGAAGQASAQTLPTTTSVTVLTGSIQNSIPHDGFRPINWINYSDCIGNSANPGGDVVSIGVALTNPLTYTLQAWVGTQDCTPVTARTTLNQTQCWLVASQAPSTNTMSTTLNIPVRSILAGFTSLFGQETGTPVTTDAGTTGVTDAGTTTTTTTVVGQVIMPGPEACVQPNPQEIEAATAFTVYFMLIDPGTQNAISASSATSQWTGMFKLVGPQPPDTVNAGIGGNLLVVNFSYNTPPVDQTINNYNFYCDPPPGNAAAVDAGLIAADAGAGTATTCAGAPMSQVLTQGGMAPGGSYLCGGAQKTSTGGNAAGLVDGVPYNVAVAAEDTYENTGPLSVLGCGVPQPVTGFFKAYRDAGGLGGGGYCSFSMKREPLPWVALLGLASCLVFRRRRAA
jgi:hypothetical protein